MADILLPRAVGYAAGFLDAFFRGSVGATYEDQSLTISGSTEAMMGDFRLLYERSDGTRRELGTWAGLRIDPDGAEPAAVDAAAPRGCGAGCALLAHLPRSARAGVGSRGWDSSGVPVRPATLTAAGRPLVCVLLRHVHRVRQLFLRDDEPATLGLRPCAPVLLHSGIHRNQLRLLSQNQGMGRTASRNEDRPSGVTSGACGWHAWSGQPDGELRSSCSRSGTGGRRTERRELRVVSRARRRRLSLVAPHQPRSLTLPSGTGPLRATRRPSPDRA